MPLSGTAAVSNSPTSFLIAIIDAGDADIGSDSWYDWRFWFSAPIDMSVQSGDFVVPYAQGYVIQGRGKKNGDWAQAILDPAANATGTLDAEEWSLDYHSTFPGGWVQIHLEGPVYATSP